MPANVGGDPTEGRVSESDIVFQHNRMAILPLDILQCIMPLLSQADLSRFMQTCASLNKLSVPFLLRACHITGDLDLLVSFCEYVLRDPQNARFIRILKLEGFDLCIEERYDQDNGEWLEKILGTLDLLEPLFASAHNIEVLSLEEAEWFAANHNIFKSLASLQSLRVIHMQGICLNAVKLLQAIEAPVTEIDIHSWAEYRDQEDSMDLATLVPNLSQTLRVLRLHSLDIATTMDHDISFPHVHTLEIVGYCEHPSIQAIAYTFPNLVKLTWGVDVDLDSADELEEREEVRGESEQYDSRDWKSLDTVNCSAFWAYLFAFREGSVRHWICDTQSNDFSTSSQWFHQALDEMQPKLLDLRIRYTAVDGTLAIFPSVVASITHLRIDALQRVLSPAHDAPRDDDMLPIQFINKLNTLSSLVFFAMTLNCDKGAFAFSFSSEAETPPCCAEFCQELYCKAKDAVESVAVKHPTLKHIHLVFRHVETQECLWKLTRNDGEVDAEIIKLSGDAARAVAAESPFANCEGATRSYYVFDV